MTKVAAAAYPIAYHASWEAWQEYVEDWVKKAALEKAGWLVFPEYGSIELVSLLPKAIQSDAYGQIREMQIFVERFQNWYTELAKKYDVLIVAPSFPLEVSGKIINRAWVFTPKGLAGYQDKFFMTPFEKNEWGVSSSEKILSVFETEKGSFGIQICYDGEFAVGSYHLAQNGAQLILHPSCTETIRGATRVHVGARARALENQCYTLVSQTIGEALWTPAADYNYGYCGAYSTPDLGLPEEGIFSVSEHQKPLWHYQEFDFSLLEKVRKEGGVLNYEDHKTLDYNLKNEEILIRKVKC